MVPREAVDVVSGLLFGLDVLGLEECWLPGEAPPVRQPWDTGPPPPLPRAVVLRGWWPAADEGVEALVQAVEKVAARWLLAEVSASTVTDQNWAEAWRDGFRRIELSERLAVAPPWDARPGDLVIEPGMAFGTGEHPTTRACLAAIDRLAEPGRSCLDVGCGTGVLALAAARLGMVARGIDNDPEAVRAARENAAANGLDVPFDLLPLAEVAEPAWLVVANLYAEVLVALAPELSRLCRDRLVLAGILADRAHLVEAALGALRIVRHEQDGEWVCLELRR